MKSLAGADGGALFKMKKILTITAALLLTALPAGVAMAQNFPGGGQDTGGGYNRRTRDNSNSQDNSGYGGGGRRNRDNSGFGKSDNWLNSGTSGFSNRNSGFSDSNASFNKSSSNKPSSSDQTPAVPPKSTGTFNSKPLPPELVLLTKSSIFAKDHRAVAAPSDTPKKPIFDSPVAKLIFRGAMRPNGHFEAYIEDSANSKPAQWVSVGQLLTANGAQIIDITLDHIVVDKSGTIRQIEVGDNLDSGTKLPGPPVTASAGPGASMASPNSTSGSTDKMAPATGSGNSRTANTAAPAAPAVTASTTGTASDEDVAEMMRRRRVQELGQ